MIAIFPEIVATAAAGDVERLAILVRKYFAGTSIHAPQIDMTSLLMSAGLDVQRLPLGAGTRAALLAKDERGKFSSVAVLAHDHQNQVDSPASRFLLAHLLGHFLFDIQPLIARGDFQVSGYRESMCPLKRYGQGEQAVTGSTRNNDAALVKELRADDFAAAVLLPMAMVRKAFASFKEDVERTAQFFGVTKTCLVRRLGQLGVLDQAPLSFLDAEQTLRAGAPSQLADTAELDDEQLQSMKAAAGEAMPVPRAFAASSYDQTEKNTSKSPASSAKGSAAPRAPKPAPTKPSQASPSTKSDAPSTGGPGLKGMERIRQLAKRLDKSSS